MGRKTIERLNKRVELEKLVMKRSQKLIAVQDLEQINDTLLDSEYEPQEMDDAIAQDGILTPILVAGPYEGGMYKVVDGMRRVKSVLRTTGCGDVKVPCYVVADGTTTDMKLKTYALAVNIIKRDDVNSKELRMAYGQLLTNEIRDGNIKKSEAGRMMSDMTGLSARASRAYITLADKAAEPVKDTYIGGEITLMEAERISNSFVSPDQQKEVMDKLIKEKKSVVPPFVRKDINTLIHEVKTGQADFGIRKQVDKALAYLNSLNEVENLDPEICEELADACERFLAKIRN